MDGWMNGRMNGCMVEYMDRCVFECVDGVMAGYMDDCVGECIDEYRLMSAWMDPWIKGEWEGRIGPREWNIFMKMNSEEKCAEIQVEGALKFI